MLSLKEKIEELEQDLLSPELKISPYHDMPFAMFRYDPELEFELRKEVYHLAIRLKNEGKDAHIISLADLFYEALEEEGGKQSIIEEEKELGFIKAQESLNTIFSDPDYCPISNLLAKRIQDMNPEKDIVILLRAGIFAPDSYRISVLLDEMHRKTFVPIVLFYPGKVESKTGLKFMNLPKKEIMGSYHIKIYNRNE